MLFWRVNFLTSIIDNIYTGTRINVYTNSYVIDFNMGVEISFATVTVNFINSSSVLWAKWW
jgi:hypothetical protein